MKGQTPVNGYLDLLFGIGYVGFTSQFLFVIVPEVESLYKVFDLTHVVHHRISLSIAYFLVFFGFLAAMFGLYLLTGSRYKNPKLNKYGFYVWVSSVGLVIPLAAALVYTVIYPIYKLTSSY